MKTLFSSVMVMAMIIMSSFTVNQQQQVNEQQSLSSCFSGFRAHRMGKANISLTWSASAPDVVQFVVERSYDGEFFDNIHGVHANGTASYKYKDNGVYPGIIYYRITAIKTDGSTEHSAVETVRIVQRG